MRWRFTLNPATDNKEISEPGGWSEIIFTINRDKTWHGIFTEYSLPLEFFDDPLDSSKDAYTFLRTEYEALGVQGFVVLKVEWACDDDDDFTDEGRWQLNFESYEERRGDYCTVKMNLEPDSTFMTFKNRYDQKVSMRGTEAFNGASVVLYDRLNFKMELSAKAIPEEADLQSPQGGMDQVFEDVLIEQTVSSGVGSVEHTAIAFFQWGFQPVPGGLDEIETRNSLSNESFDNDGLITPIYNILIPGEYTIEFDANPRTQVIIETNANATNCGPGDKDTYEDMTTDVIMDIDGVETIIHTTVDTGCWTDLVQPSNPASYSAVHNFLGGEEIKFFVKISAHGEWNHDLIDNHPLNWTFKCTSSATLTITAKTLAEDTFCWVSAINEAGSHILETITNNGYKLLSAYYGRTDSEPYESPDGVDGCGSLRMVTAGLDIRSFLADASVLTLSFKEWFEGLNAIDNIGLGITTMDQLQKRLRVEPMEFWYGETVILQLDKIPLVFIEVLHEEHYSIFKIGYQKWENEEYTGLDEFATRREYRTNLTAVRNTKEQLSNFIASGYAIEIGRRKRLYDTTTQEDWRFDNDPFIICCLRSDRAVGFEVEQGTILTPSDLYDAPSVYNFRISPIRNLMRWAKTVLNSYRNVFAVGSQLKFTSGDGNYLASGQLVDDCALEPAPIAENETISTASFGDPLDAIPVYIPEAWKFEYPLSMSQYTAIKESPTEIIQCRFNQEATFRDFYIRSIEFRPNDGMAKFTLLPRRLYPIDECSIYIIQTRGNGTTTFGSTPLTGAALSNLFVFVNGHLMKYNDAISANNEIVAWDDTTGYGELSFPVDIGTQVTIIYLPIASTDCQPCIDRFEGRGNGTDTVNMSGFGIESIENLFCFYNGELMKYNDAVAANNEILSYNGIGHNIEFDFKTHVQRELRVFAFRLTCECITVFSGNGDGTTTPQLDGIGTGSLANIFCFYNGNLQKYNDQNAANNEAVSYNFLTQRITLNTPTNEERELRAFKLVNC